MNHLIARIFLFPILALITSAANAAGRYDLNSGIVDFQCVSFVAGPYYWRNYTMTLAPRSDGRFSFAAFQESPAAGECDTAFDVYSSKLEGQVRVVDDIYSVELQFDSASSTFTFVSAKYLRASNTALWVLSDGVNKLFLGGTIHVLRESDFPIHAAFLNAYDLAETVVFEYDPAIPIVSSDLEGFNLPPGESLLDYLSPGIELLFDDYLKQFGRSLTDYSRKKPRFFNNDLYFLGARSYGYGSGVDAYFMNLARADGKLTGGLETVVEQVDALVESDDEPDADWDDALVQRLAYIKSGLIDQDLARLINEWRGGSLEWISASVAAYQFYFPQEYQSVIVNRNRSWIPVIESYLATPEIELILAGFSHFAGPDSVLRQLEDLGYTIEEFEAYDSPFDNLIPDIHIQIPVSDNR